MASPSDTFFERSQFSPLRRGKKSHSPAQANAHHSIRDSWREDFRFSDELEALEYAQNIQATEAEPYYGTENQQYAYLPPSSPSQPVYGGYQQGYHQQQPQNSAYQQPQTITGPTHHPIIEARLQAQQDRIFYLEQEIARLQNQNAELLYDNEIMAKQLQMIFDDHIGEEIETDERDLEKTELVVAKKGRYQKIWGKLHLLL